MKKIFIITIIFLVAALASCGGNGDSDGSGLGDIVVGAPAEDENEAAGDVAGSVSEPADEPADDQTDVTIEDFTYTIWPEGDEFWESQYFLLDMGIETLFILKNKDWGALGALVHPEQGLLFSPYGYIDTDTAVVLGVGDVKALEYDEEVRNWGIFAGKGDPIDLTFAEYYDRFIFNRDFTRDPRVSIDKTIQTNLLENLDVLGYGASFVEFNIPGTEEFAYMDWNSLRIVIGFYEGYPYLVGIVHDEWTP